MIDPALRRFYSLGIDRGQRKRGPALLGGLAMFVLASAACALATTIGMLIAARGVQALAIAAIAVVPRAVVRDQFAGDRAAHVLSLMGMVLGIAPIVALTPFPQIAGAASSLL
jgi:MFS transporter, DHA1 family, multidrug resistance protein